MIIDGDLTIYTVHSWKEKILRALGTPGEVVLDLSQVEEFDSAGLQLLMLARRECESTQKALRLRTPAESVMRALRLCQLTQSFDITEEAGQEVVR